MKKNIHFFSSNSYVKNKKRWDSFGLRGKEAMEFAGMSLPILPGFIIDAEISAHLADEDISKNIKPYLKKCEEITGKIFNDEKEPLLVKVVISPNLAIMNYPALHNFGLTEKTLNSRSKRGLPNLKTEKKSLLFLIKALLNWKKSLPKIIV